MILVSSRGFIYSMPSRMLNLFSINSKNMLNCFLTRKLNVSNPTGEANIADSINISKIQEFLIVFPAHTPTNKMAQLNENIVIL